MDERYREAITQASTILAEAMLKDADELIAQGRQLDARVRRVVLRVGLFLTRQLFSVLQQRLIEAAKVEGFTVQRRPVVTFNTLLGPIEVESAYLYNRERREGRRPMREVFGVVGRRYSDALERALTDFGIEKSFGRAAKQFAEHYGWEVGRTTVLRLTEGLGEQAERFVAERFKEGEQRYQAPDSEAPKADLMITALDGCMLRTGKLMTASEAAKLAENDNERKHYEELPPEQTVRFEKWREVRTGFARRPDQVEPLYVCRRGDYETLCRQLFGTAGLQGLGFDTQVIGLIDGANGLKEAMEVSFAKLQNILDRRIFENSSTTPRRYSALGTPKPTTGSTATSVGSQTGTPARSSPTSSPRPRRIPRNRRNTNVYSSSSSTSPGSCTVCTTGPTGRTTGRLVPARPRLPTDSSRRNGSR